MIIYVGEGDFTSEIIPVKYLRKDVLPQTQFTVGDLSQEPDLILPKGT